MILGGQKQHEPALQWVAALPKGRAAKRYLLIQLPYTFLLKRKCFLLTTSTIPNAAGSVNSGQSARS